MERKKKTQVFHRILTSVFIFPGSSSLCSFPGIVFRFLSEGVVGCPSCLAKGGGSADLVANPPVAFRIHPAGGTPTRVCPLCLTVDRRVQRPQAHDRTDYRVNDTQKWKSLRKKSLVLYFDLSIKRYHMHRCGLRGTQRTLCVASPCPRFLAFRFLVAFQGEVFGSRPTFFDRCTPHFERLIQSYIFDRNATLH